MGKELRNTLPVVRNALLIVPKYYGYEKLIETELRFMFERVAVIYENYAYYNKLYGIVKKRAPRLCLEYETGYYERALNQVDFDVDVVLIIRGDSLDTKAIKLLKTRFSSAKFILYEWDSVENLKNAHEIAAACDIVQTFDPQDATKYNWGYLPLFHHSTSLPDSDRTIDVCYVGLAHSNRALVATKVREICDSRELNLFDFLYSRRTRIGFALKRYVTQREEYAAFDKRTKVHFKSLAIPEMDSIYASSKVVVDYAHPGQRGLTMRTIECLGQSCKLVTNNKTVLQADFYDERNIYVYEGVDVVIPESFLDEPYHFPASEIVERYHISNWISRVLGEGQATPVPGFE